MEVRILKGEQDISLAKEVLYKIYVEILKWTPPSKNPSDWEIMENMGTKYLTDKYDRNCTWFGVFDNDKLCALSRVLFPIENCLEVELYQSIPSHFKVDNKKICEINRVAILPDYLESPAMAKLTFGIVQFLIDSRVDYSFLAAPVPSPADFCISLGFEEVSGREIFKYNPDDPNEVSLLYLDCKDASKMEGILAKCGKFL